MKRNRKAFTFVLAFLTVIAAALVALSITTSRLDGLFKIVSTPVKGIQKAFSGLGQTVSDKIAIVKEYDAVKEEIERLRRENEELKQLETEQERLRRENEELRELLGLEGDTDSYELLRAAVITKDVTDWYNEFTIDLGLKDGVGNGAVVVTAKGLVGIVYNAGYNSAKVRCVVDEQTSLMCRIRRNDELLRVVGTSNENYNAGLIADRISRTAAIYAGDVIVTADSGGVYPAGLVVGTVVSVEEDEEGNRTAVIEPANTFTSLTYVTVMLPVKPEGPDKP